MDVQTPFLIYITVTTQPDLIERVFRNCEDDHCLYFKRTSDLVIYVAIYVDDILAASRCQRDMQDFKAELNSRVEVTGIVAVNEDTELGCSSARDNSVSIIRIIRHTSHLYQSQVQ